MKKMREILFRGQTRRKGEKVRLDGTPVESNWVYGGYCKYSEDHGIIYQSEPEIHKYPVYADSVGQYTGLTDKNGRKIFEGDILIWGFEIYVITYIEEYGQFLGTNGEAKYKITPTDDAEVIGNVHDNPDFADKYKIIF